MALYIFIYISRKIYSVNQVPLTYNFADTSRGRMKNVNYYFMKLNFLAVFISKQSINEIGKKKKRSYIESIMIMTRLCVCEV